MRPDVIDLHRFYQSALGRLSQSLICQRLEDMWPTCNNLRVLGVGYALPFVEAYVEDAERVVTLMPASQGVMHWPSHERNLSVLGHESAMPFPDALFDRVLMVHSLEHANYTQQTLREVWRILAPNGRAVVVVPNRTSIWSRFERTPYGHGKPYSVNQLTRQLRESLFQPTLWRRALFAPPMDWQPSLKLAPPLERLGSRILPGMGGVIIVEATKQIYGATETHKPRLRLQQALRPSLVLKKETPKPF